MTISEIDPASGDEADYADVATWEAALGSGEQIASIWNTGDVGALTLNDPDPSSVLIRPRDGHQHNGTLASVLTSARALSSWTIARIATVRGIAFQKSTAGSMCVAQFAATGQSATIDGCLCSITSSGQGAFGAQLIAGSAISGTVAIRNCIAYANGTTNAQGITCANVRTGGTGTATLNLELLNNTLRQINSPVGSLGVSLGAIVSSGTGGAVVAATVRNNAAFSFATGYAETETPGSGSAAVNWTASRNASSDSTADNFGGAGHLVDQAAGDWFADVAADLRQVHRSPGVLAGIGAPFYKPEAADRSGRPASRRCGKECGVDLRA